MSRSINQALSEAATRRFFPCRTAAPEADPPSGTSMSREEWEQLSPGFRREITRQFGPPPAPPEPRYDPRAHKAAVEYAGRKRL
jgi:hypothetical protein